MSDMDIELVEIDTCDACVPDGLVIEAVVHGSGDVPTVGDTWVIQRWDIHCKCKVHRMKVRKVVT